MTTFLKRIFLEEPRLANASWRFGFLAFVLALLVVQTLFALHLSPSSSINRFQGFVVPLGLLLNHLAYQFRWPLAVMVFWRVVAWGWIIFGSAYMTRALVGMR